MSCGRCKNWDRERAEAHPGRRGAKAISVCRAPMPRAVKSTESMFSHEGDGCPCFVDAGTTFEPESLLVKAEA